MCTEERPFEDTARRWPPANQGKGLEKPNLLIAQSLTFSFQNYKKINLCNLSHPVCGTLFWQPWQANTDVYKNQGGNAYITLCLK